MQTVDMQRDKFGTIQPTELQHRTAEAIAAIIREALPTRADKEIVVAILFSAATGEEREGDRLTPLLQDIAHNVCLDIFGSLPPQASLQARLDKREAC